MVLKYNVNKYFDYYSITLWYKSIKFDYYLVKLFEIQNVLKILNLLHSATLESRFCVYLVVENGLILK